MNLVVSGTSEWDIVTHRKNRAGAGGTSRPSALVITLFSQIGIANKLSPQI